jgi:RNA polymerase sigma-70 factor (ECF subfamily)
MMLERPYSMTDEEAVALALKEKAFFGHIVLRYEDKLSSYIRRLGIHNEEDRQDVLQNIFIKVYRNLNGFDTSLSFSSWIYRIAHNEAISFYRMKNVRPEGHLVGDSDDVLALVSNTETDAEKQYDEQLNAEEVTSALYALDPKYRDPLILRFFEHKEYEEISDILKIPSGTVGTLIYRGKQELKKKLRTSHIHV